MSNLRSILNPDVDRAASGFREYDQTAEVPESPASATSGNTPNEGPSEELAHQDHPPHHNCPDTLNCLPDTDGRPQHTLPVILRCAILGSPRKRLTIREIYGAMESKYPYYKTAGQTWKQSVRHHLSLNRLFERQPRPVTDPGFGSYWTVNLEAPPGTKRPRKRGRPNKDNTEPLAAAKRRGRPRKDTNAVPLALTTRQSTLRFHNGDDYEMGNYDEDGSEEEDDYESEDDGPNNNIHPFERRPSLVGLTLSAAPTPTPSTSSTSVPPRFSEEDAVSIIERLNIENQNLRRQSADAVQLTIRLTDQIAQVQSDASRSKATVKNLEEILNEEAQKRHRAEAMVEEEIRLRRAAENELRLFRSQHTPRPS